MSEIYIPETLPVKQDGFTRQLGMHMNFGPKGGAATYKIFDPQKRQMPFGFQYDTRKGGLTGFILDGRDGVMTWAELVEYWPEYLKSQMVETSEGA